MRFVWVGAAAVAGVAASQAASAADCTYRIVIYGMGSSNTFSERIDSRTVEHTTTTRIGTTASAGTLTLRTDGTYEIRGYLGLGPSKAGRWIENNEGPFSDKGGVELLEVKGAAYGPNDRSWFVYTDTEGNLVAREPPYTAYQTLALKNASGPECASRAEKGAKPAGVAVPPAAASPPATGAQSSALVPRPPSKPLAQSLRPPAPVGRAWTMQEFRQHFMGKTREQIIAELGQPIGSGYKSLEFGRLRLSDAENPSVTSQRATISFTEQDSGEAWHIYFAM